jgi:hypothetical protein
MNLKNKTHNKISMSFFQSALFEIKRKHVYYIQNSINLHFYLLLFIQRMKKIMSANFDKYKYL